MSAPQRRRTSRLADEDYNAAPAAPETPAPPTSPATPETPGKTVEQGKRDPGHKVTVSISDAVAQDAKDAYWAEHTHGRVDKWAHFVEAALAHYTRHLQHEVRNGEPFPARPQRARNEPFSGGRPLT